MSKVVEISPTTRHEGHSKLVLKVKDAGIIETGNWCSIIPVRGVEKLAVGKTPEQVPKIASRVCGICPIAHNLAATEAMEASIKCEIPTDAKMLRHILQLANLLHSIALHDILILPDLYLPGTEIKINPFTAEEPVRTVAKRIHLKSHGILIFLDVDFATLESRIRDFSSRGIAKRADQSLADIFDERFPLYRKHADMTIKCGGLTQEEVCARIIEEGGI